jgi:hypothetical protein
VGTRFAEQTHAPIAVAKGDEVLAQQADKNRRAITLRHFLGHAGGNPMAPHELAHRRIAFDAAQHFVFFGGEHGVPPFG